MSSQQHPKIDRNRKINDEKEKKDVNIYCNYNDLRSDIVRFNEQMFNEFLADARAYYI